MQIRGLWKWVAPILVAAPSVAAAQSLAPRIDSIFAPWDHTSSPGCALGVMQDGRLNYSRGYGMANLDYGIPNSPQNAYYVGSVSKQFTAASIALLALRGRISLDDDVRKYIPELPDYGKPIRVSDLVHHMSGMRDIYVLMDLAGIRMEDVFPDEEALSLIAAQKELNFEPGTDYLYSNSGYWILGQIVERVTGESLREFARREIFDPLGMTHSHFHDDPGHPMKNRVVSYSPADGAFRIADLANFDKIGAGGLYTTIEDLLKWDDNFYEGTVGGRPFLDLIHTRGVLDNGDTLGYAFGLTLGEYRGLRTVEHGGSLMGFRAELLRFPDQHLTVAILCNLASIAPAGLAQRVADLYLSDRMTAPRVASRGPTPERPRPQAAINTGPLDPFTGRFRSEEVRATYTLAVEAGKLILNRPTERPVELVATGPDEFRAGSLGLHFIRQGGQVTAFTVEAGRVRNIRFDRVR